MPLFAFIHLHLLQARFVGSIAAGVMMLCLLIQELARPQRQVMRLGLWLLLAIATAVFVSTVLQVQRSIR